MPNLSPRTRMALWVLGSVATCAYGTVMFTGLGLGPSGYVVRVQNLTDRELEIGQSRVDEPPFAPRWEMLGKNLAERSKPLEVAFFYRKRSHKDAVYEIGFFEITATHPYASIRLRSVDLERLGELRSKLVVETTPSRGRVRISR